MSDLERKPIGPYLDEIGMTIELGPDDTVVDALVVTRTMNLETGKVTVNFEISPSAEVDPVIRGGLVHAASEINAGVWQGDDD